MSLPKTIKSKRAVYGGVIAFIFVFISTYLAGTLGQSEAFTALQEMRPSLRFISSAVLTATSTILALILTLLSFSSSTERNLKPHHYKRIQLIARLSTIAFASAIVLLMILTLPLKSSEEKLYPWYEALYYFFITYGAFLGGTMITIVLMLYQAANAIIIVFHPHKKADHLFSSKDAEERTE